MIQCGNIFSFSYFHMNGHNREIFLIQTNPYSLRNKTVSMCQHFNESSQRSTEIRIIITKKCRGSMFEDVCVLNQLCTHLTLIKVFLTDHILRILHLRNTISNTQEDHHSYLSFFLAISWVTRFVPLLTCIFTVRGKSSPISITGWNGAMWLIHRFVCGAQLYFGYFLLLANMPVHCYG